MLILSSPVNLGRHGEAHLSWPIPKQPVHPHGSGEHWLGPALHLAGLFQPAQVQGHGGSDEHDDGQQPPAAQGEVEEQGQDAQHHDT